MTFEIKQKIAVATIRNTHEQWNLNVGYEGDIEISLDSGAWTNAHRFSLEEARELITLLTAQCDELEADRDAWLSRPLAEREAIVQKNMDDLVETFEGFN